MAALPCTAGGIGLGGAAGAGVEGVVVVREAGPAGTGWVLVGTAGLTSVLTSVLFFGIFES